MASPTQLGDFLRARRESLDPAAYGLAPARRRTRGLRREEVAARAGIGVDWYIRLEQGRALKPSPGTAEALSRALDLNQYEHDELLELLQSASRPRFSREIVPDALRRMVERLNQPAYLTGRRWDILAWNDAAAALLGDFGRIPRPDRNLLVFMFTSAQARRAFGFLWAAEARAMLAQFRAGMDFAANDPALTDLMDRIRASIPEFSAWWNAAATGAAVQPTQKLLVHPEKGEVTYDQASFQLTANTALKLTIYTQVM
jgi:transcriptional regulator with XRE-family HTH domain